MPANAIEPENRSATGPQAGVPGEAPDHEPRPLTLSLSRGGGKGVRRTGEEESHWFKGAWRNKSTKQSLHLASLSPAASPIGRRARAGLALLATAVALTAALRAQDTDWHPAAGHRWKEVHAASQGGVGFTLPAPTDTGVLFTNALFDLTVAYNRIMENGSGVALGDVDGDGWCDIYLCGLEGPNALFRNLGQWRFEDIMAAAGVACPDQYSTGAALADIDGDGDLDLLVNSIGGGSRAFLNDGHAHFTELTDSRLVHRLGATSLALGDIDGDGDLDLYVTNYRTTAYRDKPAGLKVEARMENGQIIITPADRFIPVKPRGGALEVLEKGERDFLYVNDGRGRFSPASWTSGAFLDEQGRVLKEPPAEWGLSVVLRDLNGDGKPDIYVCNDFFFSWDFFWLSQPNGGYRAASPHTGRNMSLSSMSVDFADINRDGHDDFFVTEMVSRSHARRHYQRPEMMKETLPQPVTDPDFVPEVVHNTLFLDRGDGTYAEIAQLSGVNFSEWSWGAVFLDVDLDGYEDLLIPTGNNRDVQDADARAEVDRHRGPDTRELRLENSARYPRLETPTQAFRNRGDLTFEETGARWGFHRVGITQGLACADLDNDGDLDLVANNLHANAALFRNESTAPRVAVRLRGVPPNTRGIGAKIEVRGGPVPQSQQMIAGGRYLSSDDTVRVFAAGNPTNDLSIIVTWPRGQQSVITNARANRVYEIDQASAVTAPKPAAAPSAVTWFEDQSARLARRHRDEIFEDFARQPLLSRRLGNLGPGVAWLDWNGDGFDDLAIGSGKGGAPALFLNDGQGGFKPWTNAPFDKVAARDQTALLAWPAGTNTNALLLAQSNYEDAPGTNSTVVRLADTKGATSLAPTGGEGRGEGAATSSVTELLSDFPAAIGPMTAADVDGDGDLDLFVGGRAIGGQYPAPASSRLYRNDAGRFIPDDSNNRRFENFGLVSGAVFSDLDSDGQPDLVLACEWGPIRVFHNARGAFTETTKELGLAAFTGWWNAIAAGDFDNDGRPDLLAANWGRNTKYQAALAQPLRVYYGDFNGDGTADLLEAWFDPEQSKIVPWLDFNSAGLALPFIREHITSYHAYGQASIEELIGPRLNEARQLVAATLDTMLFLNRGARFEARPLPAEAQFAPAFGVSIADFDGDGAEDVFLAQNFFQVDTETSRYDGGRGLLLRGDGKGNLAPVPGQLSGLKIYGEQRGCAVADFDRDGRADLCVAQYASETRLFRNTTARPGLRVRLRGPAGNPAAIGASLRLKGATQTGPARELHAGGGYWSQDSVVPVLTLAESARELWIRWPGGRETTVAVPTGAREIQVDAQSAVRATP